MTRKDYRGRSSYSIVRVMTLVLILTVTFVSGILSLAFLVYSAQREQRDVATEARRLETFLQGTLAPLLWNYDNDTIRSVVEAVLLRNEIRFLSVSQDNGKLFFSRGNQKQELPIYQQNVRYQGKLVGSFSFQLSATSSESYLEGALSFGIAILGFLGGTIALFAPWIIRWNLASPLKRLSAAIERFSSDDYSPVPLLDVSVREFLPFTDTLLKMGHRIQAQRDEWKLLNDELEKRVEERTKALIVTNENLEKTVYDLRQTQDYLVRSEKLASLGQLVAGIAHELNTPLGAIDSSCRTLSEVVTKDLTSVLRTKGSICTDENDPILPLLTEAMQQTVLSSESQPDWKERRDWQEDLERRHLEPGGALANLILDYDLWPLRFRLVELFQHREDARVLEIFRIFCSIARAAGVIGIATEKAATVIASLRDYARKEEAERWQEVNIEKELTTLLTLFHNKFKSGIRVVRDFEPRVTVLGSRSKLNQVWINLINNALQAMDGKGSLELSIRRRDTEVLVEFTDSGKGIAEENQNRIFEPFFTTKSTSEGMGLGLDICRQIIASHGGSINFESRPGYTVFRVTLKALS